MRIGILSTRKKLYSTQKIVEACQANGHQVSVIDHTKCYCKIGKDGMQVYYGDKKSEPKPLERIDAIIPRIGASVTTFGSAIIRQFEAMKVFTTVGSLALIRSRDKLGCLQILSKEDIAIPKTAFTKHHRDVDNLIAQIGLPLIIKLCEGAQGMGVVLAETDAAARSILQAFYSLKANIIVQEYIKEAKCCDIRAFVVNDEVVGAMRRKAKVGEFRSNVHCGGDVESIQLTKQESEIAIQATKAMGLHVAGVDILQSNRGPLIMEINSSPGLEAIEKCTNVNIAKKIVECVEFHVVKEEHVKEKVI